MEFGRLIRDSWQITWRHPFLWLLGLFAGGAAGWSFHSGGGGGGRGGGGDAVPWRVDAIARGGPVPGLDVGMADAMRWATDHLWLIVSVAAAIVLFGLMMLVVSWIAQGGLAGATADFATGRPSSPGRAWRTGLHLFWRYAGLWLLLAGAAAGIAALFAAFVALAAVLGGLVEHTLLVLAPAVLIGLLVLAAGIAAGVVVSIVVPYAQRAIAVQDVGPIAALRDGWRVLRANPGTSLLVWLLDVGLTIAAGLAIAAVMLVTGLVLILPGLALWGAFAFTTPTIVYVSVAGVVAAAILMVSIAISNTFFWSYWTLAYLRLRGQAPPNIPPSPPPA